MTNCRSLHFCLLDRPRLWWSSQIREENDTTQQFYNFFLKIFFKYNLLAVIYVKKLLDRIRISMQGLRCITSSKTLLVQLQCHQKTTA